MKRVVYAIFIVVSLLLQADALCAQGTLRSAREESNKTYSYSDTAAILAAIHKVSGFHNNNQQPDSILPMLQNALRASIQIKYKLGIVNSLLLLGNYYNETGDFKKSRQYYNTTLLFCTKFPPHDKIKLQTQTIVIKFQIAQSYFNEEKYDTAAYELFNILSLGLDTDKRLRHYLDQIYVLLGSSFARLQMNLPALYYTKKAVQLSESNNDKANQADALINMGITYLAYYKNPRVARIYLLKALASAKDAHFAVDRAYAYLGTAYARMDSTTEAIKCYKEAIRLSHSALSNSIYIDANAMLAEVYITARQYKEAESHYLISLQEAKKVHRKTNVDEIYASLAYLYAATHKYKDAYRYQILANQVKDTLRSQEKRQTVDLAVSYQTASKDNTVAQQKLLIAHQENRIKNRNMWVIGALLLSVLMGSMYQHTRSKKNIQEKQMQILQHEQEIKQLEAQMKGEELERNRIACELHDSIMVQFAVVKMSLSGLPIKFDVLANTPEYDNVARQLDYATKQLRSTAHNMMPDMLVEKGLIDAVYYFCKNLNIEDHIHIEFQYYGSFSHLPIEFELPLYRIIQELLQNVIKHSQATEVLIQMGCQNGILGVTVEDNGIGLPNNKKDYTGIGLKKMRSKVASMNGQIDISSLTDSGTTIHLEFDVSTILI